MPGGAAVPGSTRERIQLAAASVFATRGYTGAGMAEIVLGTGQTRGAVYFHFDAKADLALSLVERERDRWPALRQLAENRAGQGLEVVERTFEVLAEHLHGDVVARAVLRMLPELELFAQGARPPHEDWRDYVAYRLRQAQLLGEVRDTVSAARYADVLVSAFIGLVEHGDPGPGTDRVSRLRGVRRTRFTTWWRVVSEGIEEPSRSRLGR